MRVVVYRREFLVIIDNQENNGRNKSVIKQLLGDIMWVSCVNTISYGKDFDSSVAEPQHATIATEFPSDVYFAGEWYHFFYFCTLSIKSV